MKAMRMISPFQQVNSRLSEHQRQVRAHHHDLAIVDAPLPPARMALEQQSMALHDPVHPLAVGARETAACQLPVQECRNAAIAVGWPRVDKAPDDRQ
jgi:hypothetical protein